MRFRSRGSLHGPPVTQLHHLRLGTATSPLPRRRVSVNVPQPGRLVLFPTGEPQGVVPGIVAAVVMAVAGAISSFIAYQKKKLCFKENSKRFRLRVLFLCAWLT